MLLRWIRGKPMVEKAKMIKRHIESVLNYFDFRITNAAAEGLNSKIQTVKANARGFRSFKNFRTSIYFTAASWKCFHKPRGTMKIYFAVRSGGFTQIHEEPAN